MERRVHSLWSEYHEGLGICENAGDKSLSEMYLFQVTQMVLVQYPGLLGRFLHGGLAPCWALPQALGTQR